MVDASAPRHYNRAPIVEATLGLSFSSLADEENVRLNDARRILESAYPATLTADGVVAEGKEDVFALKSADDHYVVRFAKDRFSLSRLEPYDRWESLSAEFERMWSIFEEQIVPTKLAGFWVRYINKLRVPLERPLHEFFNVYPAWPDRATLFTRLFLLVKTTIDDPPGFVEVYMYPALDEADREAGFFSMFLINTFTFAAETADAVRRNLDAVRRIKNAVFESQLTEIMKETIS